MSYTEFIQNILDTRGRFACGDEYHERHHILPKCMGGTNDEENLIDLFAREHFEAHRLLALENPQEWKLVYAWSCMAFVKNDGRQYELTPKEYEEIRIVYSETSSRHMKEKFSDPQNNPMYGKHHTDETKRKISKSKSNLSKETRQKMRSAAISNMTDERKEYLRQINIGKHLAQDTKEKIKESMKKKWTDSLRKEYSDRLTGSGNPKARKVIRLSDNKIYDCVKEAAEDNDVHRDTICNRCKKHNRFIYYDEWLMEQNNSCLSL
jgi:hypothetical protein